MGYSNDILQGSLQELIPGYVETYTGYHPLLDRIQKGGGFNKRALKGPWVEFSPLTGGPGQLQTDRSGTTLLASTRAQNLEKGNEYGARLIYHWSVPEKDIDEASTEQHYADLVDNYGDAGIGHIYELFAEQIARGASSAGSSVFGGGADGILTLNGDQAYTPQSMSGARTGLFEYAARASQTDTVHGLAKEGAASGVLGWYNQYGNITSFQQDGRRTLRSTIDAANRQGRTAAGVVDVILADDGTYQNYAESLDDLVIMSSVTEGDPGQGNIREGLKCHGAVMFSDDAIDISDTTAFTTAAARNGVAYALSSKNFEIFTVGKDRNLGSEWLKVSDPIPVHDQPVVNYRITLYFNLLCKSLRSQAVITGGAVL